MEVENSFNFSHFERKFEFYDITWSIENFCLLLCKEDWTISGPEFIVKRPDATKWAIVLRSTSESDNRLVLFILKRLDIGNGPEKIWVEFRPRFRTISGCIFHTDSITYCFKMPSECKLPLRFIQRCLNDSWSFNSDLLTVGCEMIFYTEDIGNRLKPCSDIGLKSLSENLLSIYNSNTHHDLRLEFGDNTILAHKAILRARCKAVNDYIEEESAMQTELCKDIYVMNFADFTYESVKKILAFLYSGDINHVLEEPSIDIYENALFWNIEEIKDFYCPDRVTFKTSMQTQEHEFNWIIIDFNKKYVNENEISSPVFREDDFPRTWQLHLCPTSHENPENVALFAETFDDIPFLDAYIELAIVDNSGKYLLSKVMQCSDKESKKFGFMKFSKGDFVKECASDNVLRIIFKLRLTTSNSRTEFESQVSTFKTCLKKDISFVSLSQDLQSLLYGSDDSDAFVESNGVTVAIHKSILAARCPVFYSMFSDTNEFVETFNVSSIKLSILRIFMSYIYTGVFPYNLGYEDLIELREAAATFGLYVLEDFCVQNIQGKGTSKVQKC